MYGLASRGHDGAAGRYRHRHPGTSARQLPFVAGGTVRSAAALAARRDLQLSLLAMVAAYDNGVGRFDAAERDAAGTTLAVMATENLWLPGARRVLVGGTRRRRTTRDCSRQQDRRGTAAFAEKNLSDSRAAVSVCADPAVPSERVHATLSSSKACRSGPGAGRRPRRWRRHVPGALDLQHQCLPGWRSGVTWEPFMSSVPGSGGLVPSCPPSGGPGVRRGLP